MAVCVFHTKKAAEPKKQKKNKKVNKGGGDLTFGSAGVDSGAQPDQLVSFLRSKVLDPDQLPVWLAHARTHTNTHAKYFITSKDFASSISPPACKESLPSLPYILPKAERKANEHACARVKVQTIKCSNYRHA